MDWYWYLIIAGLAIGFISLTLFFILKHQEKLVLANSTCIKELSELNRHTKFKTLLPCYNYTYNCMSRAEFNRFTPDRYFYVVVDEDTYYFKQLIDYSNSNRKNYTKYLKKVDIIKSNIKPISKKIAGISTKKFSKIENRILNRMLLPKPVCSVSVLCEVVYTTPSRKKTITSMNTFSFAELKSQYNAVVNAQNEKDMRAFQIELERAKMSSSLRYDVLKRDGFRCQICGSTAQDGVKLHVDHIIPVSKGGRTTLDNLRTLCDRCNLGKSDKID